MNKVQEIDLLQAMFDKQLPRLKLQVHASRHLKNRVDVIGLIGYHFVLPGFVNDKRWKHSLRTALLEVQDLIDCTLEDLEK